MKDVLLVDKVCYFVTELFWVSPVTFFMSSSLCAGSSDDDFDWSSSRIEENHGKTVLAVAQS